MKALGLDACRGKWLAVVLDEGRFDDARLASDAATLVTAWPDAAAIGVDIHIGLPETPLREADRAAREFVGERRVVRSARRPDCHILRSQSKGP